MEVLPLLLGTLGHSLRPSSDKNAKPYPENNFQKIKIKRNGECSSGSSGIVPAL
jgi:hypothetical protein